MITKSPVKDEITQTVHYTGAGAQTPADDVQTVTFTGTTSYDEVTKVSTTVWDQDRQSFAQVNVPVVPGYVANVRVVGGSTVQPGAKDVIVTVTYTKIGTIVPVDEHGTPIPGAPTLVYTNDPDDPTKVTVTAVPAVPGWTTEIKQVEPADPTSDMKVTYNRVTAPGETVTQVVPTGKEQKEQPNNREVLDQQADTHSTEAKTLPQTGEKENWLSIFGLGLATLASLLSLTGAKRKNDN